MPIIFRRLKTGDDKILKNFHCNLSEYSRRLFTPHAYDNETITKVIARSERDDDLVYIAVDEEKVVAYFFLWWFKTSFPVLGIGISDAYQGQGLGKQIISTLIENAGNAGCDGVELTTMLDNDRAYTLYEKMGFKSFGVVENKAGDGRIVKEWRMVYYFNPDAIPPERCHEPPV